MGQRYGLEIRAASAVDAPGLAEWLEQMGGGPAKPLDIASRLETITRLGGTVLIAVEWGPPSGVVVLQSVADLVTAHPAGLLATFGVVPDARRRGIGRLLLKAAARSARLSGCDRLLLPTAGVPSEVAAFAAATGFTHEGAFLARPLLRRSATGD